MGHILVHLQFMCWSLLEKLACVMLISIDYNPVQWPVLDSVKR